MKKIKAFTFMSFLLLITTAIWAGKHRFTSGAIYAYSAGTYCQLTSSATLVNLTTVGGTCSTPATITSCTSIEYHLYLFTGSVYEPLYFSGC